MGRWGLMWNMLKKWHLLREWQVLRVRNSGQGPDGKV
jgi:hypothetical protein